MKDKSFANGNGNSHANGPIMPLWLRHDWQTCLARASQVTIYDFP
jgi:hypothetical protein